MVCEAGPSAPPPAPAAGCSAPGPSQHGAGHATRASQEALLEESSDEEGLPQPLQPNALLGSAALPTQETAPSWPEWLGLRMELDTRLAALGAGNVFWGLGRTRHPRRHAPLGTPNYGALDAPQPAFSPSAVHIARDPAMRSMGPLTRMQPVGYRTQVTADESSEHLALPVPASPSLRPRQLFEQAFRPSSAAIDHLLSSWAKRNVVLVWLPVLLVLIWCGMPFPKADVLDPDPLGDGAWDNLERHTSSAWLDANFAFFLFWYFGCYVAVALIFITQLFTLYRLNWWPTALGAKNSYAFFWGLSIFCGFVLHRTNPLQIRVPEEGNTPWQLKTEWVILTFATMAMPACVCFIGLRRKGRQRYRPALTEVQKPFATNETHWHIPASYRRFLWFMSTMALNLLTLLVGQAYTIVYMQSLPHTGLDGTLYVAFWLVTVHTLSFLTQWILSEKVRSRALLFVFRFFYFMVYFIFYRNLFARLRSFDQFALVQLLSSAWVCLWYPLSMSATWLNLQNRFNSRQVPWEEHTEKVSLYFYLRNIAQHTTMLAFLGWLSILHFGINQPLYPFFAFDDNDPYNYKLTMLGSLAIWASEFVSIWITTGICWLLYGVNMAQVGLQEMRLYPELVPTCVWTSLHVLMNLLFFLIQLNFS